MLKIHSFLQRIKNFLCRVLPNGKDNYKIYMAVISYTMITVLILMSPNYIYGLETTHIETMSQSANMNSNSQENEETANEAIIQVNQPKQDLQFLLYNYSNRLLKVKNLENISNFLLTNNYLLQTSEDSHKDRLDANENQIVQSPKHNNNKEIEELKKSGDDSGIVKVMATQNKGLEEKDVQADVKENDEPNANSNTDRADAKTESKETLSTVKYVVNLASNEVEVLQRIVEAEATGEDIKGKMLVANVILNRVNDKHFPDTVEEVVFQQDGNTYQFSPIRDKRYWTVKISEDTIAAVDRVLKGEDSSQGALYFSARSRAEKTSMRWFDNNLKFLYEHGGHEFFKNK